MKDALTPYGLLLPALTVMVVSGVVPAGFVIYYSLNDTFAGNSFVWVGTQWYQQVLHSGEFWWALARSIGFSALALAIEIPIGIYIALRMPPNGWLASLYIVLLSVPLPAPLIVVGYLWRTMAMPEVGLISSAMSVLGINMNHPVAAWATLLMMDAWHWTSLVVLLCYAGLRAIPDAYYQAARIDGASGWMVFRHIQLPKLRIVLLIAILLRLMDSFMIYTEAYVVTRGGPGVATTFLSHAFVQTATVEFDLGQGGAIAVIYLAIIAIISFIFLRVIVPKGGGRA